MIDPNKAIDYLLDPIGKREIHDESIELAVDALRKQIPQKLIVTTSTKRCPSCNKQLTNKGCIHSKYNYCKWCGQALDWGEGKADG